MTKTKNTPIDHYAVIGNPIAHSRSPTIHSSFAKQTEQALQYEAVLSPLDGFKATIERLIAQNYKGVNVTVPFKFEAFAICDLKSQKATMAGAVNTLVFENGKIIGHNTDGDGLIADIKHNLNTPIKDKRVLLLGAGGAAEGVFQPLIEEVPAIVTVANRTLSKAEKIVTKFQHRGLIGNACTFEDLKDQAFDIIINATSAGLSDDALPIPNSIFAKGCLAYDMMYGRETPFMKQAKACHARVSDGFGMLIEQAAYAFEIWRKIKPNTTHMIQQYRER